MSLTLVFVSMNCLGYFSAIMYLAVNVGGVTSSTKFNNIYKDNLFSISKNCVQYI